MNVLIKQHLVSTQLKDVQVLPNFLHLRAREARRDTLKLCILILEGTKFNYRNCIPRMLHAMNATYFISVGVEVSAIYIDYSQDLSLWYLRVNRRKKLLVGS